ncbi:MAG: SIMPL domain-containing protein, partial [Planctomycetota bacterium]|nr:SIMPL domain-containing protein [Planctomycetota bacterium]
MRLAPTEARLVLGFFTEGEDAQACRAGNDETIGAVRGALLELGVAAADVLRDFIAITPRYTWGEEGLGGERALVERRTGYRLDEHLHVHVRDLARLPQ